MYDQILALAPHVRAEAHGRLTFLLTEDAPIMLTGEVFGRLLARVDGQRSVGALIEDLDDVAPAVVLYAIGRLRSAGHLVSAETQIAADPRIIERALSRLAAQVPQVTLHGADDLADPALAADWAKARAAARPWLPVVLAGRRPLFGPLFSKGGEGPCPTCLRHALMHNRPVERFLAHHRGAPVAPGPRPIDPPMVESAAAAFAVALRAALSDAAHPLRGAVGRFDNGEITWHPVRRRPQCAGCGDPALVARRADAPVRLVPRPVADSADGGHRICTPEQTLERLLPLVDPLTGVLARLEPVAERHHALRRVYSAAWRICPLDREPTFDDFDRPALGKGRTDVQARVGALCEALERYSTMWQGDERTRRARFADLVGRPRDPQDGAIHPDALQLYSRRQYAERERLNAQVDDVRKQVPPPFDDQQAIDWSPAYRLGDGARRWVPTALCYPFRPIDPAERGLVFNPNGHAAGNCLEEAVLQGLLERVERDAVSLWWYARCRRRAIDLDALGDPWFGEVRAHYAALGFRIWVLDLTTDLGIPATTAIARREEDGALQHAIGFGCHLDGRRATQRALTELNQLFDPVRLPDPWDHAALPETDYLEPHGPPVTPGELDDLASGDLTADVKTCVARLARAGVETLVIDQTRPDIPLSVAKVITPGLCHFWPRFGPERLYRVPVEQGWRAPFGEADLNPVHLFL